jgi:hypothetical protein
MLTLLTALYQKFKFWIIVGTTALVLISGVFIYYKGRADMLSEIEGQTATSELQEVKGYDELVKEITGLPDADLDKRYSRWLRD